MLAPGAKNAAMTSMSTSAVRGAFFRDPFMAWSPRQQLPGHRLARSAPHQHAHAEHPQRREQLKDEHLIELDEPCAEEQPDSHGQPAGARDAAAPGEPDGILAAAQDGQPVEEKRQADQELGAPGRGAEHHDEQIAGAQQIGLPRH
ncbi:MAG: hypothetical protein ACRDZ4_18115 [Egibacteraceae bacterium]